MTPAPRLSDVHRLDRGTDTSESQDQIQPRGTRQRRMQMDVVGALEGLAGQSRPVVVIDVAVGRIENIEEIENQLHVLRQLVTTLEVRELRRLGSDRIVFVQRART